MHRHHLPIVASLFPALSAPAAVAEEESEIIEAMEEYFEFVDYAGATIFSQQIPAAEWSNFFVVDTRSAEQ